MLRVLVGASAPPLGDMVQAATTAAPKLSIEMISEAKILLARLAEPDAHDLLLIDFELPGLSGLRGLQLARKAFGTRPIGVLLSGGSLELAKRIIGAGAQGILTKDMRPEAIAAAITLLAAGHTLAIVEHNTPLDPHRRAGDLSERELQVLTGLCEGLQNKEIAHSFEIQEVTVKMHMRAVIRKLGANNRTHAAMIARDLGIC